MRSTDILINSEQANNLTHDLILEKSKQVSFVKKEMGKEYVLAFMTKLINELGRCIQNDWTVDDKIFFAQSLINEYWYIRMDDFIMAFKNGLRGKYGKVYGKLDFLTLCDWVNKWFEDRERHLETKNGSFKESYDLNNRECFNKEKNEKEVSMQRQIAEFKNNQKK